MNINDELREYLLSKGASDVGFAHIDDGDFGECKTAVSIVVRLSDAIVEEIDGAPTHTYFSHYRAVNAFIDRLELECGLFLQRRGFRYITVAASQSVNDKGWNYCGRYSHKKAARLAGLGSVGKNSLFLHRDFGARVRLGTVMTDMPLSEEPVLLPSPCTGCGLCVKSCPAGAITGRDWSEGIDRSEIFDPQKCSEYMKRNFQHIGRGAVCGICMRVCPANRKLSEG